MAEKRSRPNRCYLCGSEGPLDDREHVIPKSLFPKPAASNLPTLPAHRSCDRKLQKDEEVFRVLVAASAYEDPTGLAVWTRQIRPMLNHREAAGLRRMLADSIQPMDVYSPGGIFRGRLETLQIQPHRVEPVLEKVVRGLYSIERQIDYLQDVDFSFFQFGPGAQPDAFSEAFRLMPVGPKEIAPVISYRFGIVEEEPRYSMWGLFFYRKSLFIVFTQPAAVAAEIVER